MILLFAVFVAFDQVAKALLPVFSCNKGIAWSIPVNAGVFYFAWTAIIAALLLAFFKTKLFNQKFPFVLIFSGAVSNLADRIRFGCVVDYIDLKFWPIFNLADVYITLGVIFILTKFLKSNTKY